nr:hypothetical protein pKpn33002_00054 [Klebsiella pneumoniae]UHA80475.1 hypothetical protein pKpnJMC_00052 [Klebsiella pneumoniae]UHA81057.1 hypothetical protein pKpnC6_00089 [Klebsiella pneumoniae]
MSALLIDSNWSSLAESFYAVADFDPNVTFSDGTRLINHPLDEVYLRSPCGLVAAGMIPKSEFQVRAAMLELSYCTKNLAAFGFFSSLFQKAEYKGAVIRMRSYYLYQTLKYFNLLMEISEATFYNWRSKYAGLEVNEAKRLKELEVENNKLKKMLADKMLEVEAMKDVLSKKW